ncbi:MAG: prolipoprotein diacylglyceryl transferase [Candidatus Omnitrophica bacterium]|jgi:phosphatidylglycerol:prolipoprotein diacylglycerol transferase|nr:prolipoprotein diacylglyceryl transferase [Candidatus Omnitrophota bacterium]
MHPVLFQLGPITIYTYGFFVFLGVLSAYLVCRKQAKNNAIDLNIFSDIFFWTLIFAFIGARILYLFVEWEIFLENPLGAIFSRSGFVFYGGIIGGVASAIIIARRKKIDFFKLADIFAVGIPLGHSLGRLGCFFYGCCYGKPSEAFYALLFPAGSPAGGLGVKVIPTQLISAFALFLIFFLLLVISKHKKFNGQILVSYLFIYGIFRFLIEFLRGDPRGEVFMFSTSQIVSIITVIVSIILFFRFKRSS